MKMKLLCPNGHQLRVGEEHAGKRAACPRCKIQFIVPRPVVKMLDERKPAMSDTSIVNLLGSYDASKSVVAKIDDQIRRAVEPPKPKHECPRCSMRISGLYQVCPHCRLYLPDVVRQIA